jgi:phospholipid-translocating ATPase
MRPGDESQISRFAGTFKDRLGTSYKKYFLELVLRQKPLAPSKDGRHIPLRPSHDKLLIDERRSRAYLSNSIRSSRYTIWDFLPKQFFFQATRLNNVYFIAIGIPQAIPGISTTGNFTTILPVLFFICLTVAKEGYDDYRRHRLDKTENNRVATVLRRKDRESNAAGWIESLRSVLLRPLSLQGHKKSHGHDTQEVEADSDEAYEWVKIKWHDIRVGDIVRFKRNEAVPADIALLYASNENGVGYIETMALDGETNLKSRQAPHDLRGCSSIAGIKATTAEFVLEDPNRNLYDFNGRVSVADNGSTMPLTPNEVVYRGSVLRNTSQAIGMVINTGEECKIRMNANHHPKAKKPRLERKSNQIVLFLILYVVSISVGCSIGYLIWHQNYEVNAWYLKNAYYSMFVSFRDIIIGFLIMFNNVIPLALYISLEIVKIGQMLMVQGDVEMFDEDSNTPMICNTNTILENLGQVSYVFSDKTGTLTENVMKFQKMSIGGVACSHESFEAANHHTNDKPAKASQTVGAEPTPRKRQLHFEDEGSTPVSPTVAIPEHGEADFAVLESPRHPPSSMRPSLALSRFEPARPELSSSRLMEHIRLRPNTAFSQMARDFILGMALCHTALPEVDSNGDVDFEAASPDDVALVRAARELGYTLIARSSQAITLQHTDSTGHQTELRYEILDLIDFSSKRKRMSIILRCPDGRIWMLCKGADSVIVPRLQHATHAIRKSQDIRRSRQLERQVRRHSEQPEVRESFSARVSLALSGRGSIDVPAQVRSLDAAIHSPTLDVPNDAEVNEESLTFSRCFQHMDDFATDGLRTLLFAQKTISASEYATWKQQYQDATTSLVDRQEKIEAVGEMIEHGFELLGASAIEDKLQKGVPETVEKLRRADMKIWMLTGDKRETAINIAHSARICTPLSEIYKLDISKGNLAEQMRETSINVRAEPHHSVAVIDGQTLAAVEEDTVLKELFYSLISLLDSVICCRASPSQKAGIVRAIRGRAPSALTLAIGDGSNDIAMIQASHVGIGISGKEGLQAARVADYSIAQFRFLQRLLLVHGRWNYIRTAKFILWTFFKEFFFYTMQALYQRYDGYTGSSLYENWSLTVLNTLFTSLCVIVPGIFEQDLQPATLLAVPELYRYGPCNKGLNLSKFLRWMIVAAAEGLIVWFVTWAAWGYFNHTSDNGTFALGDLCFSLGIAWQNIKLLFVVLAFPFLYSANH